MHGTLEHTPAGPRLRLTRRLAHPPERSGERSRNPPTPGVVPRHDRGRALGGRRTAALRTGSGMGEGFDGEVLAYEPPTLIELRWGTDVIRFEVRADGDGTELTLLDTIDELGKAARDGAGWHVCLDQLEHQLAGTTPTWSPGDRWREVHPGHVAELGPEAATIGPPGTG